jgi:hypothetical protein
VMNYSRVSCEERIDFRRSDGIILAERIPEGRSYEDQQYVRKARAQEGVFSFSCGERTMAW